NPAERAGAKVALQWLDEQREQVPGRTITEREVARVQQEVIEPPRPMTFESMVGAVLDALGITVVPDPEPTDEELLAGIIRNIYDWTSITSPELLAKYLNTAGVTPPR